MPQGPDGNTIIVVKKVVGHAGHHGGAWKVAYADFVTAMMALFMVLWLVNTASVVTRERIASYFQRPGIFERGSGTPLEVGGGGILPDVFAPPSVGESRMLPSDEVYAPDVPGGLKNEGWSGGEKNVIEQGPGKGTEKEEQARRAEQKRQMELERFMEIRQQLEQVFGSVDGDGLGGLLGQLDIKIDQRGLHLEIMDTPTASMFALGSASIRDDAEQELMKISKILVQLPNPVDIEGHTDSRPFRSKSGAYDNWDLSIDRANSARRVLSAAGMRIWQINRVVGFADRRPKVSSDPLHASNRRISISMRFTEQAAAVLRSTNVVETQSVPIQSLANSKTGPSKTKEARQKAIKDTTPFATGSSVKNEGLKLEVTTSRPEGEAIAGPDDEEGALGSRWREKDKIFNEHNPFFD